MNECLSTRWVRCLAWMSLGWFAVGVATLHAAEPKYLSIAASFLGKGENPLTADDVQGAKQEWNLLHTYTGTFEVTIRETEISPAPVRRTRLVITPTSGSGPTNRAFGFIRDTAMNGYREFGEGGSSAKHQGDEVWSASGLVPAEDLGLTLTLEPEAGMWGVQFAPGVAEAALLAKQSYQGIGDREPGHKGFGELWQYVTGDPNQPSWLPTVDNAEQRGVYTRYHPRDSVTLTALITQRTLLSAGTNYTGAWIIPVLATLPGKGSINLVFSWTLLDALPEVELVVRSPRYSKWLPTMGLSGRPGEPLRFVATVESPKGEDISRIQVDSIRWTLVETSREPGFTMNYPIKGSEVDAPSPDLAIEGIPTESDGQVGDEPEPEYGQSEIEIEPNDWGGWSVLRVEAKLKDGRVLKGRLETPPDPEGEYDIRLPLRDPQSKIARVWLQKEGVSNQEDAEDSDPSPKGSPGIDGDGLTLYQEYRGFQVRGSHLRTNPKVKDLFIRNSAHALAASAIQTFANVSGLAVHLPQLDEFDPERRGFQINRNRKESPTRGPQAGLLVKVEGYRRPNDDIPPGTRPGSEIPIRVPEGLIKSKWGTSSGAEARNQFVLQALFQSVNVRRPGPTDESWDFIHKTQPPGSAQPPEFVRKRTRWDPTEEPVVVLDLAGADLAQTWNAKARRQLDRELKKIPPNLTEEDRASYERLARMHTVIHRWVVGTKGGSHSGPEECLMRDWFAEVHESELTGPGTRQVFRYIDPKARPEKPGTVLGTTQEGTGINAGSNPPESRYGPRTAPGPASEQLAVNDNP